MALTFEEKKLLAERLAKVEEDVKSIKTDFDKEFQDTEAPSEEPEAKEEPEAGEEKPAEGE